MNILFLHLNIEWLDFLRSHNPYAVTGRHMGCGCSCLMKSIGALVTHLDIFYLLSFSPLLVNSLPFSLLFLRISGVQRPCQAPSCLWKTHLTYLQFAPKKSAYYHGKTGVAILVPAVEINIMLTAPIGYTPKGYYNTLYSVYSK